MPLRIHLSVAFWGCWLTPWPSKNRMSSVCMPKHCWNQQVYAPRLASYWGRAHQRSLVLTAPLRPKLPKELPWLDSGTSFSPGWSQEMKRWVGKGKLLGWRFGKIPQSFHDIKLSNMGKSSGKTQNPDPSGIYHQSALLCLLAPAPCKRLGNERPEFSRAGRWQA